MGTDQESRHKLLNGLYWLILAIIAGAALSHWLIGVPSNRVTTPLFWIFMAVCAVGLINALGLFGRR
jgi:hypothetical protein